MTKILGGITFEDNFGLNKLPQGAASAWSYFDGLDFTGAGYKPLFYCGTQGGVKGTNYWFIAEQTLILAEPERHIVKLAINEFKQKIESTDDEFETVYKLVPQSIEVIF